MARVDCDPYYSRVEERWAFAPRVDPVLWGDGNGVLSARELAFYLEHGFVVKHDLFNEREVSELVSEVQRMASAADRRRDDVITEPGSDAVRSLFRVHLESQLLLRLIADRRLSGVASQILAGETYIHQSRINFKPAFEGKAFPWHSDFETWHVEDGMPRMRALSASLLLTSNTEHNGPLLVIPRSHRRYVRCVGETPSDHFRQSLRKQEYGVPDREALSKLVADGGIASITGRPGSVVFFDCNLMHGSGGNITPLPRHNIFLVYNSIANLLVEPFGGKPPRPLFLAEREPLRLSA